MTFIRGEEQWFFCRHSVLVKNIVKWWRYFYNHLNQGELYYSISYISSVLCRGFIENNVYLSFSNGVIEMCI